MLFRERTALKTKSQYLLLRLFYTCWEIPWLVLFPFDFTGSIARVPKTPLKFLSVFSFRPSCPHRDVFNSLIFVFLVTVRPWLNHGTRPSVPCPRQRFGTREQDIEMSIYPIIQNRLSERNGSVEMTSRVSSRVFQMWVVIGPSSL